MVASPARAQKRGAEGPFWRRPTRRGPSVSPERSPAPPTEAVDRPFRLPLTAKPSGQRAHLRPSSSIPQRRQKPSLAGREVLQFIRPAAGAARGQPGAWRKIALRAVGPDESAAWPNARTPRDARAAQKSTKPRAAAKQRAGQWSIQGRFLESRNEPAAGQRRDCSNSSTRLPRWLAPLQRRALARPPPMIAQAFSLIAGRPFAAAREAIGRPVEIASARSTARAAETAAGQRGFSWANRPITSHHQTENTRPRAPTSRSIRRPGVELARRGRSPTPSAGPKRSSATPACKSSTE